MQKLLSGLEKAVTYNLGEIQGIIADGVENEVLQPVDDVKQLLAQRRHGAGYVWVVFCSFGLRLALRQANTLTREVGAAQLILRLEGGVEMVRDDRRARVWVVACGR